MKVLKQYSGRVFKRGQVVFVNGEKLVYSKMIKGKLAFRREDGSLFYCTPEES